MESPKFRNKISLSAGMKNQGLRDILTPTSVGVEVESIESIIAPLHKVFKLKRSFGSSFL